YEENIEGCPDWVPTVGIWNQAGYEAAYPTEHCDDSGDTSDPAYGCVSVKTGMSVGPTKAGIDALGDQDPGATWISGDNPDTAEVEKGYVDSPCMNAGTCQAYFGEPGALRPVDISPRILSIAIFDTTAFVNEPCSGTGCGARVVNLGGFFIEGMCFDVFGAGSLPTWCGSVSESKKIVIGRFMKYPGQFLNTGGPTTNSFAQAVRLVR